VTDSIPHDALVLQDVVVRYSADGPAAVDGVSLTVGHNRSLGIVGESGSGKSTLAKVIVDERRPTSGDVRVYGRSWSDLTRRPQDRRTVQMIFQNPSAALNPRRTVLACVAEAVKVARGVSGSRATELATSLLAEVGIHGANLAKYPRELSGGLCQRVVIARALACDPRLLVADEPTSALDVSVQAQIINLLTRLRAEHQMSLVFISHNIAVIGHITDDIIVMRGGRVVEAGSTRTVLTAPQHPYTRLLLEAAGLRVDELPQAMS